MLVLKLTTLKLTHPHNPNYFDVTKMVTIPRNHISERQKGFGEHTYGLGLSSFHFFAPQFKSMTHLENLILLRFWFICKPDKTILFLYKAATFFQRRWGTNMRKSFWEISKNSRQQWHCPIGKPYNSFVFISATRLVYWLSVCFS